MAPQAWRLFSRFSRPVAPFLCSPQSLHSIRHSIHYALHLYPILFLFSVATFAGMVPAAGVPKVKNAQRQQK